MPKETLIINTGEMVSKAVKKYLEDNQLENNNENEAKYQIYLTDTECNFINVACNLLQNKKIVENIQKI